MKYTIELTENQKKQMDALIEIAHKHIGFNPKLEPIENSWESELEKHRKQAYDNGFETGKADARLTLLNLLAIPSGEWVEMFDTDSYYVEAIFKHYSINEIAERIKAYEEKKKAEEEIKVGDEVTVTDSDALVGYTFIVMQIIEKRVVGIRDDWRLYENLNLEYLEKTGRHFDEVEQLLGKLNEGKE